MTENFLELKSKAGVWHCHGWVNGERVRRSTKTSDRMEAEEQRVKWLKDGAAGMAPGRPGHTVGDVLDAYMAQDRANPFTYATRHTVSRLRDEWETTKLVNLDTRRVMAWADKFYKGQSKHVRAKELSILKAAIRYGAKHGMVSAAPHIEVDKESTSRVKWLEKDELKRFLEVVREDRGVWLWALLQFMAFTGGRRGELITLRWTAIDLERKQVTLMSIKGKKAKVKLRTVPLNGPALEAARAMIGMRVVGLKDDYVFKMEGGKPWPVKEEGTRIADRIPKWAELVKKAGLENFKPHDLRHTFATMCRRERRMELDRIAELLGHTSTEMTKIYAHLIVEDHREDVDSLTL
ncbi:XerC Integrase [uncultured Caudovirales phage]|uniref:Integrase n=1 Tax=uncultured Caudovirales phage TaxID=2100421 RepID=A0A6J7WRP6_9CAUD|nr:XerC Integrase [uncultured Caudovirales phage]